MNNKIKIAVTKGNEEGLNIAQIRSIAEEHELSNACQIVDFDGCEPNDYDALLTLNAEEANAATERFSEIEGATPYILYVVNGLKIAHLNADNAQATEEGLMAKASIMHQTIKRDLGISNPRIAILATNNGDGHMEEDIIKPAIEKMMGKKMQCFGPYLASTFFEEKQYENFDAVLAMTKSQIDEANINGEGLTFTVTMGLPFVHIAMTETDEENVSGFIYDAINACRNRSNYDMAHANPLPKLYHEQKEGEDRRPRFAPLEFLKKDNNNTESHE